MSDLELSNPLRVGSGPQQPGAATPMRWVALGAVSAAIAVAAGAFGAHGLRARLTPDLLAVFEIAVRYQMYHALALIAVGLAAATGQGRPRLLQASGWLFFAGSVAFCGSLYLLSLAGLRWLGAIAPIGGTALIGGWLCLALAALRGGVGDRLNRRDFAARSARPGRPDSP